MARLIDADVLLSSINQFDYYDQVLEAPTVNAIVIPDNATNGDVIKALFPNGKECFGRKKAYYSFYPNGEMEFNLDWWNAPYKENKDG